MFPVAIFSLPANLRRVWAISFRISCICCTSAFLKSLPPLALKGFEYFESLQFADLEAKQVPEFNFEEVNQFGVHQCGYHVSIKHTHEAVRFHAVHLFFQVPMDFQALNRISIIHRRV